MYKQGICGLRKIEEEDLELILAWRNHEQVRINMYTNHIITIEEHVAWWKKASLNEYSKYCIFTVNGNDAGFVSYTNINQAYSSCDWAFYLGDINYLGIGSIMEYTAICYAFEQLKINRLACQVLEFNEAVIKLHKKFGFLEEGILRQAYTRDKIKYDIHLLSLLSDEWKQVKPKIDTLMSKLLERY